MTFIFPILCILVLIFPIFVKIFPKFEGKGSFPKSQIKSMYKHLAWKTWALDDAKIWKDVPHVTKHLE